MGVVGGRGLAEALREDIASPALRRVAGGLVLVAITFGCAAYETGNLLGAALGGEGLLGLSPRLLAPLLGIVAGAILWVGSYRSLERLLIATVLLMSGAFLGTILMSPVDLPAIVRGAFIPASGLGDADLYLVIALVGTTVVPYNLFLHAAAVRERFEGPGDLAAARTDAVVTILLGGLISGAVVITAGAGYLLWRLVRDEPREPRPYLA